MTPAEVTIPRSRVIDFTSTVNGHSYRLNIALPFVPAPAKGYRVLYLFDGNGYFGSATEAVRSNGNATDVVVVGIGYPDTPEFVNEVLARRGPRPPSAAAINPVMAARAAERPYDLTLPATDEELVADFSPNPPPYKSADLGGIDALLKTIEVDVKPRIEALVSIDKSDQVLFGHSLGGLAVLRALFSEPNAFRTFIIASPSIWWNNRVVLKGEPAFAEAVRAGTARPRVLITVGAEELPPPVQPGKAVPRASHISMVDNARELAATLKALHGAPGFEVADIAVFPDQKHGISPWPAIGRGISFAFSRPPPPPAAK